MVQKELTKKQIIDREVRRFLNRLVKFDIKTNYEIYYIGELISKVALKSTIGEDEYNKL